MKRMLMLVALLAIALPAVAAEATSYEDIQVFDTIVCDVVIVKDWVRGNSNFFRIADDADGDVTFTVESALTFTSGDSSAINFGASALTIASAVIAGDVTGVDSMWVTDLDISNDLVVDGDASVGGTLGVTGVGTFSSTVDVVDGFTAGTIQADNGAADTLVIAVGDTLQIVGGVITYVGEV